MIFILEDNADRIEHFGIQLGSLAHHVEKTVPEAIAWLTEHKDEVSLYSLDNDLYVPDFDGDEGEGWELCEWMLANVPRIPIIVHSTNAHASMRMKMACGEAGLEFHRVVPYLDTQWIGEAWIATVRQALE